MAIILVKDKISKEEFQKAKQDYGSYIKITADLNSGMVALGGEYHADAETLLLKKGASQKNIWGGGFNLETKQIEANAIINIRPGVNDSPEILNPPTREKFILLVEQLLEKYV